MPIYEFDGPDGKTRRFEYPEPLEGVALAQAADAAYQQAVNAEAERESKQQFVPNIKAGAAQAVGSGIYGLADLIGYDKGKEYGKGIVEGIPEYADIPTFDEVKGAYGEGVGEGLGETWDFVRGNTGQVLGGLAPYAATAYGGAKAGAMAGAPLGPVGSTVGGITGAVAAPALTYFFGQNRMRQEEEIEKARQEGKPIPEFDTGETLAYSALQSGAERLGLGVLGRYFPIVNKILGAKTPSGVGEAAKTGLGMRALKGAGAGVAVEVPVELTQQVLERQAAGLPLDTPEAFQEYEEILAATAAGVAPLGASAGMLRRNAPQPARNEPEDTEETPSTTMEETPPIGPVPEGGEQLAMPGIGQPQLQPEPEVEDLDEPINRTQEQQAQQQEFDFDEVDPRSAEAERQRQEQAAQERKQEEFRQSAQEARDRFEAQEPEVKLQNIEDELARFDEIYPLADYPKSTRTEIRKDLNARKKRYQQERNEIEKRQKEDFDRGVEYLRSQSPITGIVDLQVAKALGVSPRATNTLNQIIGQDLDTKAGRDAVARAIVDYDAKGQGKVAESPLAQKLVEERDTDYELEPEGEMVGPVNPMQDESLEGYYRESYKRAFDRRDPQAVSVIEAAAREAMGARRWGRVKSKITRGEKSQMNQFMRDNKQPDMFPPAQVRSDAEPEAEAEPEQDVSRETQAAPDSPETAALQRAEATDVRQTPDGSIESVVERDGMRYRVRWSPKKELTVEAQESTQYDPNMDLAREAYEQLFPPEEVQAEQEGTGKGRKAKSAVVEEDAQTRARNFVNAMRKAYEQSPDKDPETAELIPQLLDAATEEVSNIQGRNLSNQMRDALGDVLEEVNRSISKPRADRAEARRQELVRQLEQDRDELTQMQAEGFAQDAPTGEAVNTANRRERRKAAKEIAARQQAAQRVEESEAELQEGETDYVPETEEENAPPEMPKAVTAIKEAVDDNLSSNDSVMNAARVAADEGIVSEGFVQLMDEYLKAIPLEQEFAARKRAIKSIARHVAKADYLRGLPSEVRAMYRNISNIEDPSYRRGRPMPARMTTVGNLKRLGNRIISKLGKDFPVEIVQGVKDVDIGRLIPDDVQGMHHEGKVYIFADNVHPAEFESILAHEVVGHAGMEKMLGEAAFQKLVDAVNELKADSPVMKRISDNIKARYTNADGEYNLSEAQEAREIIAHMAEGRPQYITDSKVQKLWNRIKNEVKRWLAKMGFGDMAEIDLDRMIMEAAEYAMGNDHLTGAPYDKPQFAGVDMMRRAWKLGYRGTDMDEAGQFMRDVHEGRQPAKGTTEVDIDSVPADFTQTINYDEPSFARAGTVRPTGGPGQEFDKFIERDDPVEVGKGFWKRMYEATRRGDLFDTFRVEMVDGASVFDDRIMKLFNNAARDAEGVLNPAYNYSQATRAEGLAADVMRTGELSLHKDGIWVAGDNVTDTGATIRNINNKAAALGERIGHERARKAINMALISLRDRSLAQYNNGLQKLVDEAVDNGNQKLAEKYQNMQKQNYYDLTNPEHKEEYEAGLKAFQDYPEIQQLQKMWREFNNKMIDARVKAGLLDSETAKVQKKNEYYVPFSRVVTDDSGEFEVGGYQQNQSGVSGVRAPKAMKGALKDSAEINDVLDNMVRLTLYNVSSVVRNHAAQRMVEGLRKVAPKNDAAKVVTEIDSPGEASNRDAVVSYWEDGARKYFELDDALTARAFRGTEHVSNKLFTAMAGFANILRRGVTFSPEFIISQLQQDMFRSAFYGGTKSPFKVASKVLPRFMDIRRNLAEGEGGDRALNSLGIAGMIDYSPELSREQIERAYRNQDLTFFEKALLWAERNAEASDLAPRKAIYDQTMAETGDRALAMYRANEIINFNRRGAGSTASILRQIIPFQNAYMQGMNVMVKTLTGRGLSALERKQAIAEFVKVGLKLSALSATYAMLMGDDEEYQNQADYLRSRYFMIPTGDGTPPLKFAAPPDIGLMFKMIPEMIVSESMYNNLDDEKAKRELKNAVVNAIAGPDLMPQIVKPLYGLVANYDYLTGGPIIAPGEENLDAVKQYRDSTSELSRALGHLGVSPIQADYFIRGTLGSLGGTMLAVTDEVARGFFDLNRPETEIERMPIARALFGPRFGAGVRTDFYQMRDDVRGAVQTLNRYVEDFGTDEQVENYIDENMDRLQAQDAVNNFDQVMQDINKAIKLVTDDPTLSPTKKRREIDKLKELQNSLSKQVREIRKQVYGE